MRVLASTLAILLSLCACASREAGPGAPASVAATNARCPIMPDLDADGQTFVEWKGRRVGFCCAECIERWDRLGDDQRARLLEAATPSR